jgi:hypothetical protein
MVCINFGLLFLTSGGVPRVAGRQRVAGQRHGGDDDRRDARKLVEQAGDGRGLYPTGRTTEGARRAFHLIHFRNSRVLMFADTKVSIGTFV